MFYFDDPEESTADADVPASDEPSAEDSTVSSAA